MSCWFSDCGIACPSSLFLALGSRGYLPLWFLSQTAGSVGSSGFGGRTPRHWLYRVCSESHAVIDMARNNKQPGRSLCESQAQPINDITLIYMSLCEYMLQRSRASIWVTCWTVVVRFRQATNIHSSQRPNRRWGEPSILPDAQNGSFLRGYRARR
jgi:hypothetical protein